MSTKPKATTQGAPKGNPPPAPESQGVAAVHTALEDAVCGVAVAMGLQLGMEGETFTPPMETHLRGKVMIERSAAAALGKDAPTRHDGRLEITIATKAGLGTSPAMAVAQSVLQRLARGMELPFSGGEVILCTGMAAPHGQQTDRARALVTIPFYAFTTE